MSILGIGLLLIQVQLGSVSGIVTKPGGNAPLPGATVILTPSVSTQTSRIRTTISEDDGRFTIRDIEPGEYRLQIQSAFYGNAAYGQRKPDGPGTILTIAAGKSVSDLKVSMLQTGAIAGRITGRDGEPLAYVSVQALKYLYQEGRRVLAPMQTATTDDRGEYRLFWLPAGRYVVVATPRSSPISTGVSPPNRPGETTRTPVDLLLALGPAGLVSSGSLLEGTNLITRILGDGTVQEESWMPTYYAATTVPAQATPVDVTVNSTVTGINITLGPSLVQKIRGRVTGFNPANPVLVTLVPAGQGTTGRSTRKAISPVDGSFEFAGVLPGPYYVNAQEQAGAVLAGVTIGVLIANRDATNVQAGPGLAAAPTAVLVGDRDVENLSIALAPAIALSLRVTAEGVRPAPSDPGLTATLQPEFDGRQGTTPGGLRAVSAVMPGSTTVFANVPPGDYQLNISQGVLKENAKALYIKSIRFGREDAFGTVHVSPGATDVLEVVLTAETGSVEGVAIGRAGGPAGNATVVLVPTNARKRTALYKTLVTGSDGKFRFSEIPPGDYKLFAWDEVETGAWQDAEFLRPYESRGRAVRVSENSKEEVQLNVIYNP